MKQTTIVIFLVAIVLLTGCGSDEVKSFNSDDILFTVETNFIMTEDGGSCENSPLVNFMISGQTVSAQASTGLIYGAPGQKHYQIESNLESDGVVISYYVFQNGFQDPVLEDEIKGFFLNDELVFSGICANDVVYEIY